MINQFDGEDSIFLAIEGPTAHLHTGALAVVDPTASPDFSFAKLRQILAERIVEVPKLTWLVKEVPLQLHRPYWIENPDFDIDDQLHRIALPGDGGDGELAAIVGDILSRPLSRDLPLWELWFIEGLRNGRVGIVMKTHHCLFDGVSGASLGEILADLEPDPPPRKPTTGQSQPTPKQPSMFRMLAEGTRFTAGTPQRMSEWIRQLARRQLATAVGKRLKGRSRGDTPRVGFAPRAAFNGSIGARRGMRFVSISLKSVKQIKDHFDVTVNDVVLAICGHAFRVYLEDQDRLPERSLVAGVPTSTRGSDDDSLGNKVGVMSVPLATDTADDVARLKSIHRYTSAGKDQNRKHGAVNVSAMGDVIPPLGIQFLGWLMWSTRLDGILPLKANSIISNVPGPPMPLYIGGAKVDAIYPLAPILVGMGISITIFSYQGQVNFGITFDPAQVPRADRLVDGINQGLADLLKTVPARQRARKRRKSAPRPKAKPRKSSPTVRNATAAS